jgi:hypothetical protein
MRSPAPRPSHRARRLALGAAVAVAAAVPGGAAAGSPAPELAERATNGGFEAGTTGWRPTTGTNLVVTAAARTGAGAAELDRPAGGTVMLNNVPDVVGVPAGSTCTATAWVQAPAGRAVRVRVRELDAAGAPAGDHVGGAVANGAWQQLQATYVAGGGALDVNAWALNMAPADRLRVDDVSLRCTAPGVLFFDAFGPDNGIITNEFATWNPTNPARVASPDWEMTSGSLLAAYGSGWTGVPDGGSPDARSETATGSAVFRLNTRRHDFGDVDVAMRLRVSGLVATSRTPATDWDGVHIWMRYRAEEELYYASVNRRDGAVVIKKKCAGGSTNGGTYHTLASAKGHAIPLDTWQDVAAGVQDNPDGTVTLRLWREGRLLLEVTDRGTGCAPLTGDGAVGVRGDNANFLVDDFTVRAR